MAMASLSVLLVLAFWRGRVVRAHRRGAREPGRGPGLARRGSLELAALDVAENAALGVVVLPLAAGGYAAFGATPGSDTVALAAAIAAALQTWALWSLWLSLRRWSRLRLGYEAELAAGQELNALGGLGYVAFHDVPLDGHEAKADHVVVGPGGVFAVRTEARGRQDAQGEREVTYDGVSLRFSRRRETAPLERAVALAGRVREWLCTEIGEPLLVQPLVVLPGWQVRRTDVSGIPVLAASRIQHYFGRLRPRTGMSKALIERVAQCLEARCRGAAVPAEQ